MIKDENGFFTERDQDKKVTVMTFFDEAKIEVNICYLSEEPTAHILLTPHEAYRLGCILKDASSEAIKFHNEQSALKKGD